MKTCPECNENFRGRSDKRFCSADCKSAFHNKKNRDHTNLIRNINNSLRRNRRIIKKLCKEQMREVNYQRLIQEGFRFGYFTHMKEDEAHRILHYCYDVAYCKEEEHVLLIAEK